MKISENVNISDNEEELIKPTKGKFSESLVLLLDLGGTYYLIKPISFSCHHLRQVSYHLIDNKHYLSQSSYHHHSHIGANPISKGHLRSRQ